jgi:hypothetical protein
LCIFLYRKYNNIYTFPNHLGGKKKPLKHCYKWSKCLRLEVFFDSKGVKVYPSMGELVKETSLCTLQCSLFFPLGFLCYCKLTTLQLKWLTMFPTVYGSQDLWLLRYPCCGKQSSSHKRWTEASLFCRIVSELNILLNRVKSVINTYWAMSIIFISLFLLPNS